ncbi:MAG: ShlB/FhaC/HecB family hemolysin secretion/activation protein [Prochloron sp. SP5CPC1]|nr:ShlB/FhaC/HecB family hemolysin secretion/activation protein [Candidatus Paraprochloron terpiosi SP5CPC1]
MSNLTIILIATMSLIPFSIPCHAQTSGPRNNSPLSVRPTPKPVLEPQRLPPLEDILPKIETDENKLLFPGEEFTGTITVSKFNIVGSTIFSLQELEAVLAPYRGKPISFAELLQAADAITKLYVRQGYVTSSAFIPPQALQNGSLEADSPQVVLIEIIEGSVEEIQIKGLKQLNPSYVRSRLETAIAPPLNQDKLLDALQLLQLDPLIQNLSVELRARRRRGMSVLEIKVIEADLKAVQLTTDNQRSPSIGSVRRKIELTFHNPLGVGDRLQVGYINTEGSNSLDNLRYTIPINPRNGTLSFGHTHTESEIVEEPFDLLQIESKTLNYEITYRQPILRFPNEEFALGLTASVQDSEVTFLEGVPFPNGADGNGNTKISALRFFQEYTKRNNQQVFTLHSEFSLGVDAFGASLNSGDIPDSDFLAWRGQGQYLRLLSQEGITLLVRTDIQLANKALVPLEQFSVGGQLSVRGYRQDTLLADNGVFASAEIRFPILSIPDWDSTLILSPFFDFGTVWNSRGSNIERDKSTLYSVGVGLRFNIGENFNARVDYGIPLVNVNKIGNTLQENGFYFEVQYKPF